LKNEDYQKVIYATLQICIPNIELALNILAEASTTEISKAQNPKGFKQSAEVARKGGKIRNILYVFSSEKPSNRHLSFIYRG